MPSPNDDSDAPIVNLGRNTTTSGDGRYEVDPSGKIVGRYDPPPESKPFDRTISGGSGGSTSRVTEELFRFRIIPVGVILYLIFRYTPLAHEAGAYPGTVGRTLWGLALLAVLWIALAICSPTAAKNVAVFIIGIVLLGAVVLLGLALYIHFR